MNKPKAYIYTLFEIPEGYQYEQPIKYCNGVQLTAERIEKFNNLFGVPFHEAWKQSNTYNQALEQCDYNSDLWQDNEAKDKAFAFIADCIVKRNGGDGSSVTPLFPFEIYLLNDGFVMQSFTELNAMHPMGRKYVKTNCTVQISYGQGRKVFSFTTTNAPDKRFELTNDLSQYHKAINGNLNPMFV